MAKEVEIIVEGANELIAALDTMPDITADKLFRSMLKAGEVLRGEIVQAAPIDKGALRRSFKTSPVIKGASELSVVVGSDLVYARIQDEGGEIRAIKAKNLAIPLTKKAKKMSPRDWPENQLHFAMSKDKRKFLFDAQNRLQYKLQKSVKLKGSGYISKGTKAATPMITKIIGKAVADAIQETFNQ